MLTQIIILVMVAGAVFLFVKFRPSKEQRIHDQGQKVIRNFTFKQYNAIVTMCEVAVEAFGEKRLPLKVVNEYIDKAQVLSEDGTNLTQLKVENFNKTLTIFKNVLRLRSEERMKDGKIGIEEIKFFVAEFKKSFIQVQAEQTIINLAKDEEGK